MIYSETIFVWSISFRLWSVFLHMHAQLSQCHLLKRLSFPHWIAFASFFKLQLIVLWYLGSVSCPLIYMSAFSPILDYCIFTASLEIKSTNIVFLFLNHLDIPISLSFYINFRISLSVSTKKSAGILLKIELNP